MTDQEELARLLELASRLQERLRKLKSLRPDTRPTCGPLDGIPELPYFRVPNDEN